MEKPSLEVRGNSEPAGAAADRPAPARPGVQSVERAFTLLDLIADAGGRATLSELAEQADLPMPTIHRLLRTLVNIGCARQLNDRGYALGPTLMRLGDQAGRQLGDIVRPHLRSLVHSLGETANVAMLDGDMMVYAAQVPSQHSMRMFTEVGRRVHPSATGVGKAVLPGLGDDRVAQIIHSSGMPELTVNSITEFDALKQELQRVKERGYAIDEQEQELGVRCFAVDVAGAPTPMAVSVSGPVSRLDEDFGNRAVPLLQQAAQEISAALNKVE